MASDQGPRGPAQADSRLASGTSPAAGRRLGAVAAMLTGALSGPLMYLHVNAALPLLVAAALTAGTLIVFGIMDARGRRHPAPGRIGP